jgi:ribose transport system permease protein
MKKELGILLIFICLCATVAIGNANFLSVNNLQNTARLIGIFGIFSIGSGIVIITRGVDLSIGSLFALTGILLSILLVEEKIFWPLAVLLVILVSSMLGLLHGFLITKFKIQPFIITLCGLLFYRGLARYIADDVTMGFGYSEGFETLKYMASGKILGIPIPFILLVILGAIFWLFLHKSIYGKYLFAVGRNEEAAFFSGINTNRIISIAYVISGFLAGICGILLAFYTNAVAPSAHGNFYELYGIAAAVLGGCSLRGGEGSIAGIIIGAAMLQVIQNLVNLLGIPSSLNFPVMAGVILLGVFADRFFMSRKKNGNLQVQSI